MLLLSSRLKNKGGKLVRDIGGPFLNNGRQIVTENTTLSTAYEEICHDTNTSHLYPPIKTLIGASRNLLASVALFKKKKKKKFSFSVDALQIYKKMFLNSSYLSLTNHKAGVQSVHNCSLCFVTSN